MKIKVLTLFPDLVQAYLSDALLAKAIEQSLLDIQVVNLRDFSDTKYKSVDDAPFGGGDGMLIRADILEKALLSVRDPNKQQKVVYLSPQGQLFKSHMAQEWATDLSTELLLICGRYAGVDDRFIQKYVDLEISIGDYVLSGGELPALVVIEATSRFVKGVLGHSESALEDSLVKSSILEAPQYTRPQIWNELPVPDVLLSGHHQQIREWKEKKALEVTQNKRPDLWAAVKAKMNREKDN